MAPTVKKADFKQYLAEATSWETSKVAAAEKSKKLAWIIASASSVITVLAVLAVVSLTPLKTVEPFVIRVDNSTGIVDVVNTIKNSETNYEEAVNKYFTQWYVRYREGFTWELREDYYYNVGIMSAALEQQKYLKFFEPGNPMSPMNVYGEYARVKTNIKGTSFIKPNVALVRYSKEIQRGTDSPEVSHWAATITFRYLGSPMAEKDRAINPLGFQVTEFRNDPDAEAPPSKFQAKPQVQVMYNEMGMPLSSVARHPAVPAIQPIP